MVLPLRDFLSKDNYAPKMTDYGHILYVLNALMVFIPMQLSHQTPTYFIKNVFKSLLSLEKTLTRLRDL